MRVITVAEATTTPSSGRGLASPITSAEVDGVRYVLDVPESEDSACSGCVAKCGNKLCMALPVGCSASDMVWRAAAPPAPTGIDPEVVKAALHEAHRLGQLYWQHADSNYSSKWKKADAYLAEFKELVAKTIGGQL